MRGSVCVRVCVRVPSLARALFVFLLIGLFFHVQPTKPHVFPLISPARLGWSPRHARGLPEAQRGRRGRRPTTLASPDQAGQGRTPPAPALPRPYPHPSCLAFKGHGLSQPHLVASLDIPQLLDSQMLPPPPPPTSHRLLFPSQPTGLKQSNAEPGKKEGSLMLCDSMD